MVNTQYQTITFTSVLNPGTPDYQPDKKQQLRLPRIDILCPLKQWLDSMEIQNPQSARTIAKLIPAQCPFERDIVVFGRKIAHIPPLCKLNPLYEQLVGLRFRALCYLVDQCGEDIQSYC
jgi:hypothetical protein